MQDLNLGAVSWRAKPPQSIYYLELLKLAEKVDSLLEDLLVLQEDHRLRAQQLHLGHHHNSGQGKNQCFWSAQVFIRIRDPENVHMDPDPM